MPSASRMWTSAQLDAIRTTGCGLLVSAAAGSGKTAVLAERCCHLVCDAQPRASIHQLLVVTFTDAAAAEMKSRIESSLRQRLGDGADEHLRRQVALVEHAAISTVHGFCHRLLRQHFHRLGLDPGFRVLDADEALLMRNDVVDALFAERYETDEDGAFERFVEAYGDGNDERLKGLVLHTHALLCSLVDPPAWIEQARARIAEAAGKPLGESQLGRDFFGVIRGKLIALDGDCRAAIDTINSMPGFEDYVDHLRKLLLEITGWRNALDRGGYSALAAAIAESEIGDFPSVRQAGVAGAAVANALARQVHEALKSGPLREFLLFTEDEWRAGLAATAPHCGLFLDLVNQFAEAYRKEKQRARGVDFNDLERFALRLLRDEDQPGLEPSVVARGCHRQFHHVLVDEYQDINEVQDAILYLVSRESAGQGTPSNLFCVGDIKQSIYRFRLAEPSRFLDRQRRLSAASALTGGTPRAQADIPPVGAPAALGKVIDLQANFRSRGPLLDALNDLFERLMTRAAADIEYDQTQRLHAHASFPPAEGSPCFAGAPVELHLLPRNPDWGDDNDEDTEQALDRAQVEATFIARRIRELLGATGGPRYCVATRGPDGAPAARPIEYRDIVILLRSVKFKAEAYAGILRQHNIPVFNTGGVGYFDSLEVRDMLSLLSLLDNQQQDIPLAAVLRSPVSGLPDPEDAMARIRMWANRITDCGLRIADLGASPTPQSEIRNPQSPPLPFHSAVSRYAAERDDDLAAKLRDFLAELAELRQIARQRPVAELIWRIYERTGFLAFCNGLEHGQQRCANLLALYDRAKQFGTFSRQGLYRFLHFLNSLRNQADVGQVSELSEADDVVRIMSIHAAKGLEFPVVFVPDLGKRINLQDCDGHILADRQAFAGLSVVDDVKRVRYPSLALMMVQNRLKQQSLAEELRVLYVAATRAKEHLILVGTCKETAVEAWQKRWAGHSGPLPPETILDAGTMLDWIGPAVAAIGNSAAFELKCHTSAEIAAWRAEAPAAAAQTPLHESLVNLRPLDPAPPADALADDIIARLTVPYPWRAFTTTASSTSVTALAKHPAPAPPGPSPAEAGRPFATQLDPPAFMSAEATLSAADRGTAVHLVLEHLDYTRPCTPDDVADQIAGLLSRKLMAPAQSRAVDHEAIQWFIESELGGMIRRNATALLREQPFYYALDPARVDGGTDIPVCVSDNFDRVMLRGRIDLLVPDGDGFAVVDYKTDHVEGEALAARIELYRAQVDLYREAFSRATGRSVTAVYLVFLHPRHIERIS